MSSSLLPREAWDESLGYGLACHYSCLITAQESAILEQYTLPLFAHFPGPLTVI